jgi:chemotaxis protein methyltransferase CheR
MGVGSTEASRTVGCWDAAIGAGGRPWEISNQEFERIRRLVQERTGISLNAHKRSLVAARLGKRLRALGLSSFRRYAEFLTSPDGEAEIEQFVNAMTTNKTDFYRETAHFTFLAKVMIPQLKERAARTGERRIRIWSAGCSTGEEAYTIGMTMADALGSTLTWDIRILASDIDTRVLAEAEQGIYAAERAAAIPAPLLRRYFLRGVGSQAGRVKVGRELRSLVHFRWINLLEEPWPIRTTFDAVFCRNVIIYFDRDARRRLIGRFADILRDGGFLFLGHSESLHGISPRFAPLANTVYRKLAAPAGATGPGGAETPWRES